MKPNPTILLIDDDTDDQEIFSFALEKADRSANCIFANDGLHALEKFNNDVSLIPDYIFIDMNMPRMNGQQCLSEIKKINHLADVPVFMYSTSADPNSVEENKRLGAVDVIIKPSDISILTSILSDILKGKVVPIMIFILCFIIFPKRGYSQSQKDSLPQVKELKKLSVEDLMNITVTSVTRTPEKLTEVASAIQVVTNEQIKRSGALRLPGALRLATNMQVIQAGSHDVGITSRGFNGVPIRSSSLANKLLVQIDGRSVYTPLFGGVYWDVQNVMLEDIKQIEVVSGPGGALWGANAVNGIVNIISKSAKETQGIYASESSGQRFNDFVNVRYGGHVDSTLYFRVYGQHFYFKNSTKPDGSNSKDSWYITQGGFRSDYYHSDKNLITFQGDLYGGNEDDSARTYVNGQNLLGRLTHNYSSTAGIILQTYFDRTYRDVSGGFRYELNTYDIDLQHNFMIGRRNKILWGIGYRLSSDKTGNNDINGASSFDPTKKNLQLYSGFIQDQFALIENKLELTVGSKILHNDYTGIEFHPTVRIAWAPKETQTLWAAISKAVRTPSRFDADLNGTVLGSYGDFKSEDVVAYEAGYRLRPVKNVSLSIAGYYNHYTNIRSIDTNYSAPTPNYYWANNLRADTYGAELSATFIATSWWKIRGGYTYLNENFSYTSTNTYPKSEKFEALDPHNQFLIQSMMDFSKYFQVDGLLRYVDVIPEGINNISTPSTASYLTLDLRLAFHYKWLTASVVGNNLAQKNYTASPYVKTVRSFYSKLELAF